MKPSNKNIIKAMCLSTLIHTLTIFPISLISKETKPELTYVQLYEIPGNATKDYTLGDKNTSDQKIKKNLEGKLIEEDNLNDELTDSFNQLSLSLKGILTTLKVENREQTPTEAYHEYYPKDERNEVTYGEFFRVYANGFLFVNNWQQRKILKELTDNPDEDLIHLTVKFQQNGKFQITRLETVEGTKHGIKIIKHYRQLFQELNKKFVPLSDAGLIAPHYESYVIRNPARHFEGEWQTIKTI